MGSLLAIAPAAQAATVTVNPMQGVAGTGLSVNGGGWDANEPVTVYIDGQLVCQLTADSGGNISGTQASNGCQVPNGPPAANHDITATDSSGAQALVPSFLIPVAASFTASSPVEIGTMAAFNAASSTAYGGSPTNYSWNFGDGQSGSGETASHAYSRAGNYTVTLDVTDSSGDVAQTTRQVDVEGPPTARFGASPAGPTPTGTPIQFDGTGSSDPDGAITSYQWNFGDGQGSTLPSPVHTFATANTYDVTLTVTDAAGASSTVMTPVQITDRPPIAAFNPTFATVLAGSNVDFDGTPSSDPDGSITGYAWNFGDGSSATGAQSSHKYFKTGTFTVTLTVTDNSNNTSTTTHQITVIAPPPIQTLILTPLATAAIVDWLPVSIGPTGIVNLGERLFCPGPGPPCRVAITSTSASLARSARQARARRKLQSRAKSVGAKTLRIAPDGSAELAFRLSKPALALLQANNHLKVRVKIVIARGGQTTTRILNLTLRLPPG